MFIRFKNIKLTINVWSAVNYWGGIAIGKYRFTKDYRANRRMQTNVQLTSISYFVEH